ncbi:MAG: hypothetical protein GY759_13420 [Chloroflexi bacterium]|nr:hypothetical protein [Chloroflexota bacterium]
MNIRTIIKSQYHASLDMLGQTIVKCPESLWQSKAPAAFYWHVAYHALFYTHLYLQPGEADFEPWAKHRDESQFLGSLPWPPHAEPKIPDPYTRDQVLEYLDFCHQQVDAQLDCVDLEGASGFDWLPFDKLELQIYNIRHIQSHAGELSQRLAEAGIEIDWIGMRQMDEGA